MARAAILFSIYALLSTLGNVLLGAATGLGFASVKAHAWAAVPSNVLALFAWTFVAMYFAGANAWVKAAVAEGLCEASRIDEASAIRQGVLPWIAAAVLALIAAYVIGGGADTRAVPPVVHLALALIALFLHLVATYRTIVFVGMALDLQDAIDG